MGSFFSSQEAAELPQPFYKIKGLKEIRGPNEHNKFIVIDKEIKGENPIKFRYNTENEDDWIWEWTVHSDQHEWYPVKTKMYTITTDELDKHPYNQIVDKNTIIPLKLHRINTHKKEDDEKDNDDDEKDENKEDENKEDEDEEEDEEEDEKEKFNLNVMNNVYSNKSYIQCVLPAKYESIRLMLCEKDPIPPHMLKEHGLATNAYEQVSLTPLAYSKTLQCKFATKDLAGSSSIGGGCRKHPVLLFYEKGKEPQMDWDMVWMLHLMQDSSIMKVVVEFDPKLWKKFKPNKGWNVSKESYDLSGISLLDVAKWSVRYEQKHPEYSQLYNNCRKFMLKLSNYLKIKWDGLMMSENIWYTMTDTPQKVSSISNKK